MGDNLAGQLKTGVAYMQSALAKDLTVTVMKIELSPVNFTEFSRRLKQVGLKNSKACLL